MTRYLFFTAEQELSKRQGFSDVYNQNQNNIISDISLLVGYVHKWFKLCTFPVVLTQNLINAPG
jgi:hypothetical protein